MISRNIFLKAMLMSLSLLLLSHCVVTRSQLSENEPSSSRYNVPKTYNAPKPITGPIKKSQEVAELETQLKAYEEQFRTMLGRIEELETKSGSSGQADSDRVKNLEQAISEMSIQQDMLKNQIRQSQEAQMKAAKTARDEASTQPTGDLERADQLFTEGKWEKAAQEFEFYRKKNPKSDEISIVTYKIGVCFQELGLKSEAKTFFTNVVKLYPKSKASKFAKFRLNNL